MARYTQKVLRSDPHKYLPLETQKGRDNFWMLLFAKANRGFAKYSKDYQKEKQKISNWMEQGKKLRHKISVQVNFIIGPIKEEKSRHINPYRAKQYGRNIGMTGRDLPMIHINLQSEASVSLCQDKRTSHIPWEKHSTFDHWWPSQWAGEDIFWNEFYGLHLPGELLWKLYRNRQVIIVTRDENQLMANSFHKVGNFPSCARTAYKLAGIPLVPRVVAQNCCDRFLLLRDPT